MSRARAAIILAAGQGARMKSELPKVLHRVGGLAMLGWAITAAARLGCARTVMVVGAHAPQVRAHAAKALGEGAVAVQDPPLGTGHAVRAAEAALKGFAGDVIVLYADTPLLRPETLEALLAGRAGKALAVLGFEAADPTGYGRLVLGAGGAVERIVEHKDATEAERAIGLCNSGVLCADAAILFQLLARVGNNNAKGEYYLTDVVGLARADGISTHVVRGEQSEFIGVNSRAELAGAEAAFQARARAAAMDSGVTLIDPASVFFAHDTAIAADVVIEPNVFFGPGVRIAKGARIKAFSHIEGAEIGEDAQIGPFARLRPGAKLGAGVKIGNFVEVKNSSFGPKAQASHLAYIGDAEVGARANLGAGTITCNYDGFEKHKTVIGEDAFIGSNTALVAPVKVGARAYVGSGSVITKEAPDGALAVARAKQRDIPGWADAFRAKQQKPRGDK